MFDVVFWVSLVVVGMGWLVVQNELSSPQQLVFAPDLTTTEHAPRSYNQYPPEQKPTLVVYSGPSNKASRLAPLYQTNLEHFLKHGVDCSVQDTVISVGQDYYEDYLPRIRAMQEVCAQQPHRGKVILVPRRDVCYDMETVRIVFYGGVHRVDVRTYDYFVYANCGASGPPPQKNSAPQQRRWWTHKFTDLLDETVKMSGLTVNCE